MCKPKPGQDAAIRSARIIAHLSALNGAPAPGKLERVRLKISAPLKRLPRGARFASHQARSSGAQRPKGAPIKFDKKCQ